jgi:hypothetical protein
MKIPHISTGLLQFSSLSESILSMKQLNNPSFSEFALGLLNLMCKFRVLLGAVFVSKLASCCDHCSLFTLKFLSTSSFFCFLSDFLVPNSIFVISFL